MYKLHKLTPIFSKTLVERAALVYLEWSHYAIIQQIEAGTFTKLFPAIRQRADIIQDIYCNFASNPTNKICKMFEENGPTNFIVLKQNKVKVQTYKKGDTLDTQSQTAPDLKLDFSESTYQDKRIHGMDYKAYENPREFESKIFSQLNEDKYFRGLLAIESLIMNSDLNLNKERLMAIKHALMMLNETSNDLIKHQKVWAESLHLFPEKYIPPLRVPKNFAIQDLKKEILEEFLKSKIRMQKISALLYARKIPENDLKAAVDLFEDSEMKQLLSN